MVLVVRSSVESCMIDLSDRDLYRGYESWMVRIPDAPEIQCWVALDAILEGTRRGNLCGIYLWFRLTPLSLRSKLDAHSIVRSYQPCLIVYRFPSISMLIALPLLDFVPTEILTPFLLHPVHFPAQKKCRHFRRLFILYLNDMMD